MATSFEDGDRVEVYVMKQGSSAARGDECGGFAPPTVAIAGTKWRTVNLTGTPEQGEYIVACAKPEDYGSYFKFNDSYVFSSNSVWNTAMSVSPGDPCQKLGSNYRTLTNA